MFIKSKILHYIRAVVALALICLVIMVSESLEGEREFLDSMFFLMKEWKFELVIYILIFPGVLTIFREKIFKNTKIDKK